MALRHGTVPMCTFRSQELWSLILSCIKKIQFTTRHHADCWGKKRGWWDAVSVSYNSCQWFVGCFVPSFFLKKGKGYKETWRSEGIFPNFLGSCNDLQKHCKPTKFIVKLELSDRYLKLLPPKIMSWVTWYNSVAYDNKIRSKLTILSYTTIFFHQRIYCPPKNKVEDFFSFHQPGTFLPPPQISCEDLEETHQVPATRQTSKHFAAVKLPKRNHQSSIIHHYQSLPEKSP